MRKAKIHSDPKYYIETVLFGKKEATRKERVRQRNSYKFWEEQYEKLSVLLSVNFKMREKLLMSWMFDALDKKYGFKTATKADWAEESLNQFFSDKDLL